MNLFLIFLTGLTTGGLSCLAVQGGLLAGVIANQKKQELTSSEPVPAPPKTKKHHSVAPATTTFDSQDWLPVASFLGTKLIAHIILGFLLGLLGTAFSFNRNLGLLFQFLTALFLIGTAMNLLEVHPIFRYLAFQPPAWMRRYIHRSSKNASLFAPALLGALTVFIPCGVTQTMEITALNSGSAINGALIMGAFVLGTIPLFASIGVATARISESWQRWFSRGAATILIVLALTTLNGVLVVLNSPITWQKFVQSISAIGQPPEWYGNGTGPVVAPGEVQKITINVENRGYNPRKLQVKAGSPVELTLQSKETYSCALGFILPEFGIDTSLKSTDTQKFTFTPTKKGRYTFTCSMGMYTGVLEVI